MQLWKLLPAYCRPITSLPMRTVIYARKSTERDDRQTQSLEDQVRALQSLAKREGLVVAKVITESKSAKTPGTRPEFNRLIKEINAGRVSGVLVWSVNRLSRNPVDGGAVAYALQTGKISFIRTVKRIYRPEDNALLFSIENGLATSYIQTLSADVKRGLRGKVERGWHPCKAPVGYLNNPVDGSIAIDPIRFPLVRRAFELVLSERASISEVHRQVVAMGLGVKGSTRPISYARMREVLKDPFYSGRVKICEKVNEGKHTPVVSVEEFLEVQARLNGDGWKLPSKPLKFPFANLYRCSKCGCQIIGEMKTKRLASGKQVTYTYYHCSGWKNCPRISITQEDLARELAEAFGKVRVPRFGAEIMKLWLEKWMVEDGVADSSHLEIFERELKKLESRRSRLRDMMADGDLSTAEYRESRDDLLNREEEIRYELERQRTQRTRTFRLLSRLLDSLATLDDMLEAWNGDLTKLGQAARLIGSQSLQIRPFKLTYEPVVAVISTFEPPEVGSGSDDAPPQVRPSTGALERKKETYFRTKENSSQKQQNTCQRTDVLFWSGLAAQLRTVADQLGDDFLCRDESARGSA